MAMLEMQRCFISIKQYAL